LFTISEDKPNMAVRHGGPTQFMTARKQRKGNAGRQQGKIQPQRHASMTYFLH
jgi:hypothetical protein